MIGAVADHNTKSHNRRGGKQTIQHTSSAGIRHEKTALLAPPRRIPRKHPPLGTDDFWVCFVCVCVCVCLLPVVRVCYYRKSMVGLPDFSGAFRKVV